MSRPSGPAEHVVCFYRHDDELCNAIANFVAEGVHGGERVVLLATAAHTKAVLEILGREAALASAVERGQVVLVDAETALAATLSNGRADVGRFRALLTGILADIQPPVRMFGEVVSLVTALGQHDVALEIEGVGQELVQSAGTHVLCGYNLHALSARGRGTEPVATRHDRVLPLNEGSPDGPLILLADDFEDCRDLYGTYLTLKGYRVVTATDGQDALRQVRAFRPALILMDIRMPRMDGVEAMQALKRDPEWTPVPVVALTAHAMLDERETFLAQGFDAVLCKPCTPDDVVRLVEALLTTSLSQEADEQRGPAARHRGTPALEGQPSA